MPVKEPSLEGKSKDSERRVLDGYEHELERAPFTRGKKQCGVATRAKPVAYFGKPEEEWNDLSASTPFRPSDLLASRLALFSFFRSFLARLSSRVSSFRLLFDLVFFSLFLARSSRHFSSK